MPARKLTPSAKRRALESLDRRAKVLKARELKLIRQSEILSRRIWNAYALGNYKRQVAARKQQTAVTERLRKVRVTMQDVFEKKVKLRRG